MAPVALEQQDKQRDAEFNKVMHGQTAQAKGGISAMLGKDQSAQKAAVDEYFKHWDNKPAEDETPEMREARKAEYATLTRQ
jgi:sterol 24-C-methyltransferase